MACVGHMGVCSAGLISLLIFQVEPDASVFTDVHLLNVDLRGFWDQ